MHKDKQLSSLKQHKQYNILEYGVRRCAFELDPAGMPTDIISEGQLD